MNIKLNRLLDQENELLLLILLASKLKTNKEKMLVSLVRTDIITIEKFAKVFTHRKDFDDAVNGVTDKTYQINKVNVYDLLQHMKNYYILLDNTIANANKIIQYNNNVIKDDVINNIQYTFNLDLTNLQNIDAIIEEFIVCLNELAKLQEKIKLIADKIPDYTKLF